MKYPWPKTRSCQPTVAKPTLTLDLREEKQSVLELRQDPQTLVQALQPSWGASLPEPAHVCLWLPLSFMISWTFWVEEMLWIHITFLFNLFWLTQTWLTSMPPKIKERNHFKSTRAYSPILLHERYFVAYSAMGGANLLFLQGVFCNSSISSHWVPFWQLKIFLPSGPLSINFSIWYSENECLPKMKEKAATIDWFLSVSSVARAWDFIRIL